MRRSVLVHLFVASLLGGCGGGWELVTRVDEGMLCVEQTEQNLTITVIALDCLSSSCTRDVGGDCSATVDGSTIAVTSEIHWEETEGRLRGGCTSDCGSAQVTCQIPAPPEGTYTLVHGEAEMPLDVPVEDVCTPF
jgi:hypothetical protein